MRADWLVNLWILGFVIACVLQLLMPVRLAKRTSWGFARGWQTEIGLWNVAMIALLLILRSGHSVADEALLPGLALLSLMLGFNHLIAGIGSPRKLGHWAGAAGNFLGVLLYLAFLASHARSTA
jgi:KinB signaling pathway activation protein